jgi:cytochrome P450
MTTSHVGTVPESDFDPYRDEALLDPWPGYRLLRDAGPAVWLPQYEMFALTRYASVRRALQDWESFPSRFGVMCRAYERPDGRVVPDSQRDDGVRHGRSGAGKIEARRLG